MLFNVVCVENGDFVCDYYYWYNEDLDFLKDGGFDVYCFLISWVCVLFEGCGQVN